MSGHSTGLFARIDNALAENPGLTLFALSRLLGINRHSIEREVRLQAGVTFRRLKQQRCLAYAINRLSLGDYVKQVAAQLHYKSPDSFGRFIKMSTGLTPRMIRLKLSTLDATNAG